MTEGFKCFLIKKNCALNKINNKKTLQRLFDKRKNLRFEKKNKVLNI